MRTSILTAITDYVATL